MDLVPFVETHDLVLVYRFSLMDNIFPVTVTLSPPSDVTQPVGNRVFFKDVGLLLENSL